MTTDFEIRQIVDADLAEVVRLLCEGFPRRTPDYWRAGLRRLAERERPSSTEKYGYGLASGDGLHGVVLTIPSLHEGTSGSQIVVNVSSWYACPAFHGTPAKELYRHATRRDDVCYTNLSAVPHTIPTITSLGFHEWTAGQMVAVGLGRDTSSSKTSKVLESANVMSGLSAIESAVLTDHERLGCLTLCLETDNGLSPMVFVRRRVKGFVPCAQLIYCREVAELAENSRQVWAWLARRGFPLMLVDASARVPGLTGRYFPARSPKYMKGSLPLKAVDHTYSEMVLLRF